MSTSYADLTVEDVARFPRPGTVLPGGISFTPDGTRILYLFSDEGSLVRSLWAYDIATGERQVLARPPERARTEEHLSREEELRRERARLRETGITSYRIAPDADELTLILPVGGTVWLKRGDAEPVELPGTEGAIDPRPNRDGTAMAFVRGGELWVTPLDGSNEPRQLTSGAEPGVTHGLAEFMAQEELDRGEGFWWSRDGRWLALQRTDERHVPVYPIVHQGTDEPGVEEHRYPFPGKANAKVTLGLVASDGGTMRWLDFGDWEYIARVAWTHGGQLAVQVLSRDQRSACWYLIDPETGERRTLIEDQQTPWFNLDHDTHFLKSGEIVRTSEVSGFRHIELRDAEGTLQRTVTEGEWIVTGILHVDEAQRQVYFEGTRESVRERHVYRVSLDGGDIERLTSGAGWHHAVFSRDGQHFIEAHDSVEHPPRVTLRDAQGTAVASLFEAGEQDAASLGLTPPAFTTVTARDGTVLECAVYAPAGSATSPRPLIVSVYGGPHAQRVVDSWILTVDLRAQYLAQQGFIVLKVDNRGSANRGLAFEEHLSGRMGDVEVEDQVTAIEQIAAARGDVDLERVGIFGWSYGGYMTIMSMLREPEVFHVGVAGAPVTDWDGYDTTYTERYLGTPQDNPEGYRLGSVLPLADRLEGKLLIVHGMVDENVHFRHTARFMKKLAEAQKEVDTLIFPEERHMPRDARGLLYQEQVVLDYLIGNLSR